MLRIRTSQTAPPVKPRKVRVSAVRKPFDPEAFAAVLVAAALARLAEEAGDGKEPARGDDPDRGPDDR